MVLGVILAEAYHLTIVIILVIVFIAVDVGADRNFSVLVIIFVFVAFRVVCKLGVHILIKLLEISMILIYIFLNDKSIDRS